MEHQGSSRASQGPPRGPNQTLKCPLQHPIFEKHSPYVGMAAVSGNPFHLKVAYYSTFGELR